MADDTTNSDPAPEDLLASLRISEARLRGVLDSISDGFYAVDRNWRLTEFNAAAERYFALERENLLGADYWTLIEKASDEFKALLRAAMDGAPMVVLETQSLYRPGHQVELRIAPTEEGICVALTDITDRLQTRAKLEAAVAERTAALQASESRVRAMVETSHLFQGLMELDGSLVDCNAASLAAIKARKEDVVGAKFWETPWFSGTQGARDLIKDGVARVVGGEIVTNSALSLSLPTGVRVFDFALRPVRNESGSVTAIVSEANEITARVKVEEELRQAQKLEAVGQLTGGVAHDFNNLLMVISGGLNMLARSPDEEKRDMLMMRMREAVDRGANLTKQLLAFSRRHQLSPESISLPDYFARMSDLLNRSLGVNVRVAVDVSADVAPVFADPNALQLAILNLAVNARDAMDHSGVVTIRARNGSARDQGAGYVSISVADTGSGMTADVRQRIFEPFFTTKETGKGSGLGLAQVHGFAEQSGGYVEVQSELGAGSTFTLVLPRGEAVQVIEPPPIVALEPSPPSAAGDALLVEDDDNVAALTGEMLSHLGWRVTRVASAEAALGAITNGLDVGLVFSDVMMPGGKNGIELAQALRERHVDLPIVLASGYTEAVQRDAESTGLLLLSKPYNLDTLAAAINAARQQH
ncbi:MAG: PAS domain-containing protein [Alphaproteobacteria bacterium]|nr:PAS domain-containing protein [Alphaproteobacteria bacterium]